MEMETVAAIAVICFAVGEICKAFPKFPERFIPCIVGVLGAGVGAIGLYVIPGFPADNVLDAIAIGIASGLASTGAHQIYKQLSKEE